MIYDADDPALPRGIVYNADTGERIPMVYRFDDETGDCWHYVTDATGRVLLDPGNPDKVLTAHCRCRLKFVPFDKNGNAPFSSEVPECEGQPKAAEAKVIQWREFL